MYSDRIELYSKLEQQFKSKLLVYVTGDKPGMETQIAGDAIDFFVNQLDSIGVCDRISLFLYTRGGDTAAAWNIINLLKMYCDDLQVIIPYKAHSAGTIISLGANEIVMTKQATLSPIDPSINTALNPIGKNNNTSVPVSVEAVKGYLEFAKNELNIQDETSLAKIYMKLTESVHPLVLGQVYRSRSQIQMLAERLLPNQVSDDEKIKKIVAFLCSESGSHDYTINRREAKNNLGLNVIKPDEEQYRVIKEIYNDIYNELQLNRSFNPLEINGEFAIRRSLIESIVGGSDFFITEGRVVKEKESEGREYSRVIIQNESWRHEEPVGNNEIREKSEKGGNLIYESDNEFIP